MTTITPDLLQTIRLEANAALAEIAKKHGVSLQVGRASYTAKNATFKLELMAEEGKTIQDVKKEKLADGIGYGKLVYPKIDFDAVYKDSRGKTFKITGFNRRAPKHCFLITGIEDGKPYTANESHFTTGALRKV